MAPDTSGTTQVSRSGTAGTPATPFDGSTTETRSRRDRAEEMAKGVCKGFVAHDDREWEAAIEAFALVDRRQFPHLDAEAAYEAAEAYVAALWEKDRIEDPHIDADHGIDRDALAAADWDAVERCLARRAEIVGMDREYASATATAWKRHKVGGDYWTPTMVAQFHEIAAATGGPVEKPKFGQSGFGPLPAFYLAGTELHDMHTRRDWERATTVMTLYYDEVLARQVGDEGERMVGADSRVREGGADR